jgi:hypothetical protein
MDLGAAESADAQRMGDKGLGFREGSRLPRARLRRVWWRRICPRSRIYIRHAGFNAWPAPAPGWSSPPASICFQSSGFGL